MSGILTIAHLTFHEARRRKILLAALLLGLAFVGVFALGINFVYDEMRANSKLPPAQRALFLNFVTMAGLYAANFLIVMTSALLPVDTLSGEIDSGAIQSLATKPVPRASIVVGKWLGTLTIVVGYASLLVGGVLLAGWLITGFTPPGIPVGAPLMLLEGTLVMTLSIAGGTRLSTLANGVFVFGMFGLAFVGGWVEQIGTIFGNQSARYVGVVASLLMPSESLWQLAAYNMQPPIMRDVNLTPFSPASVPSPAMVAWAAGYVLATLLFAVRQFGKRNL
jgi:ABC-type transport system involved in multi-copper enzyme maturation permease subunit